MSALILLEPLVWRNSIFSFWGLNWTSEILASFQIFLKSSKWDSNFKVVILYFSKKDVTLLLVRIFLIHPWLLVGSCSLDLCVVICGALFVSFHLAVVLCIRLRFTASDYPFGIFKHIVQVFDILIL